MEKRQRVILVGVNLNHEPGFILSMEELKNLALGFNLEVVGQITQNLNKINSRTYIGSGKVSEIKRLAESVNAEQVIFNDELSASQIRNLEEELESRVIDRIALILDIFALRAKSKEAKLQVELAQLHYQLPRLVGAGEALDRQRGGGVNNKGAGETKLEIDRRRIESRMKLIKDELESFVLNRKTQRRQRQKSEIPVVSIIGYTNAGKSTLLNTLVDRFNQLVHKQVFEKDMLFATLDTSSRLIDLPDHKTFILNDTVGFINKLPHQLIKAFRSTLEEVLDADLLIHVIDYANSDYVQQMETTNQTLKEIGVVDIPFIMAYNKSDLVGIDIPKVDNQSIYLSAKTGMGLDELIRMIKSHLFQNYLTCTMLIPYDQGNVVNYFNEHAHVLSTDYDYEGTMLKVECRQVDLIKFKEFVITN